MLLLRCNRERERERKWANGKFSGPDRTTKSSPKEIDQIEDGSRKIFQTFFNVLVACFVNYSVKHKNQSVCVCVRALSFSLFVAPPPFVCDVLFISFIVVLLKLAD